MQVSLWLLSEDTVKSWKVYGLSNNVFYITRFPVAEIVVAAYLHLVSPSFYFGRVELRTVVELLQFQESIGEV